MPNKTLAVTPGSGATINTLPDVGQQSGANSLPVVLASDQAFALPAGAATDAKVESVRALLAATLNVAASSLPLPAGAATQATLASILSVLQGQRSETLWTDDAGAYYVRILHGDTLTWTDATGTTATPGTGLRPESDGGASMARTSFQATAGGTGFSTGDFVDHVITLSDKGVVLGNLWINVSLGTKLASAPSSASIARTDPLPAGAATDATLAAVKAAVDAVKASLDSGSSASLPATADLANPTLIGGIDTVRRATSTDRGGTIATGGTAQQLMAANATRRGFVIQNQSSGDLYFNSLGAAAANQTSFRVRAGETYETPVHHVGTGAISIVGATTGQAFYAREF